MRLALLLLPLLFVPYALAVGPSVTSLTYKTKSGQTNQAQATLLEYEMDFNQDLHYLEVLECGSAATCRAVNPATCGPCDYSDYYGSTCGTSSRIPAGQNCTCPLKAILCNPPTPAPDAIAAIPQQLVLDGPSLTGFLPFPVYQQPFRIFVPEGCRAVRIHVTASEGQLELALSLAPNLITRNGSAYNWYSYRQANNYVTICPNDPLAVGTFYVVLQGFGTYHINAVSLPLPSVGVLPAPSSIPSLPAPYSLIYSDVPSTRNLTLGPTPSKPITLYCFPGAPLRGVDIGVTMNSSLAQRKRSYPVNINDDLYWDASFPARLQGSYCPADPSKPDIWYMYAETDGDLGFLTVYFTANKAKFSAMPIPPVLWQADPYEMGYLLSGAIWMQCNSTFILPCPDIKGRGLPCARDFYSGLAPLSEPLPLWPPLGLWFDQEDLDFDGPSFASTTWVSNRLNWVYVTSIRIDTPDVTLVNETLPADFIPQCVVKTRPHIVNSNLEAADGSLISVKSSPMICTPGGLAEATNTITSLVNQISPQNSPDMNRNISHQLDYWNFRDLWQGCLELTNAMFTNEKHTETVTSTVCTDSSNRADPCCNVDGFWLYGCCEPRPVDLPLTSRTLNSDIVATVCNLPSCISTYLTDYMNVANVSCADSLVTLGRVKNLADMPSADCQDIVYGPNLNGRYCEVDDDCWGFRCDRRRGACIIPMVEKHKLYIGCIIDNLDIITRRALAENNGVDPSLTGQDLTNALYAAPVFYSNDCIGETEFEIDQEHDQIGWSDTCNALCDSELYGWDSFASNWPPCANNVDYNSVVGCLDARQTTFASNPLSCASNFYVCNSSPFIGPTVNKTSCDARPTQCALCWNSTYCVSVPLAFSPNETACQSTFACELINGTIIYMTGPNVTQLQQRCADIGECSLPCLDNTGRPRDCFNRTECETSGGYCTDLGLFWHDPGTGQPPFDPGACVLPRGPLEPCGETYNGAPWDIIATEDFGCIFRGYSTAINDPVGCQMEQFQGGYPFKLQQGINATWRMPSRNQAECHAQGCGCKRPQFFDMFTARQQPNFSPYFIGPPSTPEDCAACGGYECEDYFTWIPANWRGGILRPMQWLNPSYVPILSWTNAFKAPLFVKAVREAGAAAWQRQLLSETQCRFNRISATLQAVACLCTADETTCLSAINEDAPIASGYICGGLTQTVQAVPHMLQFAPTSVSPPGRCENITFYAVSRLRFANIAPAQSLSTYFTSVKKGAKDGSFAFLNSHGAPAGEVAGEGLRVVTPEGVTNVTLCFASSFIAAMQPQDKSFSMPDIAFTSDDFTKLQPLGLSVVQGDFWCASLATLQNGSYIPVWRSPRFSSLKAPGLKPSQVAVLGLAAAIYFITTMVAAFVAFLISRMSAFYRLPRFWLCVLLCLACFIRGLYFSLLGSEVITDSTVGDVIFVELPTFIWFTATTLLCLFWFAAVFQKQASRVNKLFWRLFFIVNAAMYIVFIIFVVVFSQIKDKTTQSCNGRLPIEVDRSKRRGAFVAYQIFLCVMALMLSLLFTAGGLMLVCFLRGLNKDLNSNDAESRNIQRSVTVTAAVCAAAFLLHAIFLLAIALASPGNPMLAIVLVILEITPSVFVLYSAVPNETKAAMTSSLSRSASSRSSDSGSERSASSSGYVLQEYLGERKSFASLL